MQRVNMRPLGPAPTVTCWNCHREVVVKRTNREARYIYRGEQPSTVIVEDWVTCACGAYQNVRRLHEMIVEGGSCGGPEDA
jgi:hypothetical protein